MGGRGRQAIVEFSGAENLAEAGSRLLNDPQLDLAVVRGVGTAGLSELGHRLALKRECTYAARRAILAENLPMGALDDAARKWWEEQPLSSSYRLQTFCQGNNTVCLRTSTMPAHLDVDLRYGDTYQGPLTFSLRVDDMPHQRIFFAKRGVRIVLDSEGYVPAEWDRLAKTDQTLRRRRDHGLPDINAAEYSFVEQGPGDMVLFVNHPTPSLHGVEAPPNSAARALVGSYQLEQLFWTIL